MLSTMYLFLHSSHAIVHGLTRSMEVTEEDSPAIRQCKCAISKELRSRWSLNSIDPTSPGSDLVAVCLDPRFKQAINSLSLISV